MCSRDHPPRARIAQYGGAAVNTVEVTFLRYTGLSKHPLGGWNYTVKKLGEFVTDSFSLEEIAREAKHRFPKGNRVCARETGRESWWFAGNL